MKLTNFELTDLSIEKFDSDNVHESCEWTSQLKYKENNRLWTKKNKQNEQKEKFPNVIVIIPDKTQGNVIESQVLF